MDPTGRGISVVEIPARGQPIPVSRESVTAFIGPAPRGPVNIPVALRSLQEFLDRFGVSGCLSRMELLLSQYFENGGTLAVVVRVCRTAHRNRIELQGPAGPLLLEALHPGPLEHLRAAVDYDGLGAGAEDRFNLVIHRCRSPTQPLVEEQEIYRAVSVLRDAPDFVGDALAQSALVRLVGAPPPARPAPTGGLTYVYGRADWQGDDAPTDYDLIGSREDSTGLFALEQVPWVDFVHLLPGTTGTALGPVALFAAERYCRDRHALLLLDPPESWVSIRDVVRTQRERGFASADALTWFPALESTPGDGRSGIAGAVAGALCTAGLQCAGRLALSLNRARPALVLEESEVHRLASLGVNALVRTGPGRLELGGLVTLARFGGVSTSWNSLRERRIALYILSSVTRHIRWACFETPGEPLWAELRQQVSAFLAALHAHGFLAGAHAREAFYVKCDVDTHAGTPAPGEPLALVLGIALAQPGQFVAFRIVQTAFTYHVTELGWQPGLALAG